MKPVLLRWALLLAMVSGLGLGCGGASDGMPANASQETPKPPEALQTQMLEHQKMMKHKGVRR